MKRSFLPVVEARAPGSRERLIGQNGEVNATNKTELMTRLVEIANLIQNGELAPTVEAASAAETAAERRKTINEAYHDTGKWAELGAAIALDINSRMEREGFMRTILSRADLQDGNVARIRVREKNVTAVVSRGPVQVYPRYIRDKYITTEEFYISSHPHVEELDLRQGSGDILEEKYFEGLEAIMVKEDATVVKGLRDTAGLYNPVTYFSGNFTPNLLNTTKMNVERWRLPISNIILSFDLINDLVVGQDYGTWFDPISKWEIIQTGRIGNLLGMNIMTDGYREPELKVLDSGEFFVLTTPEFLGGYTDRGPVESRASDEFDKFVPARGWHMWEMISMAIASAKGVARGKRQ